MVLNNVKMVNDNTAVRVHLTDGVIKAVEYQSELTSNIADPQNFIFRDAIIFPGLINSHDHLDFNLFSRYGNNVYGNYTEWAGLLHKNYTKEIKAVLKIPETVRTQWGIYKNLLGGVTTVVNHGKQLPGTSRVIEVIQPLHNLHSVQFEERWRWKLNNPFKNKLPYCIHIGEGTDILAHSEINELINWNFLNKKIIGIHAVAMDKRQSAYFKAIVWCPYSNHFLFEKTAAINELKSNTDLLFGTDSTLTAHWNIWDHIRLARKSGMASDNELLDMLTVTPSVTWGKNCGEIKEKRDADIVVARAGNKTSALDAFYQLNPEDILLVIKKGQIKLADVELHPQLAETDFFFKDYCKIELNNSQKYVAGDLAVLIKQIKSENPEIDLPVTLSF